MITLINLCDKEKPLLFREFVLPVAKIIEASGLKCEIKHFTEIQAPIKNGSAILCGTAIRDNLFMEKADSFQWLKETRVPVLGICAGMQVLGMVFGSTLERVTEIGMKKIRVTKEDTLFSGKQAFNAYELHNFSLNPSENLETLAVSDRCVQAVKHREKPFYGVMFHPEVRNEWLIERFLEMKQI